MSMGTQEPGPYLTQPEGSQLDWTRLRWLPRGGLNKDRRCGVSEQASLPDAGGLPKQDGATGRSRCQWLSAH